MTDTVKLKEVIQQSGLKKSYIAKQLNVSKSTLYNLLQGKAEFKASQINTLCETLNIEDATKNAIFFGR